jgi:hypothetical protein
MVIQSIIWIIKQDFENVVNNVTKKHLKFYIQAQIDLKCNFKNSTI